MAADRDRQLQLAAAFGFDLANPQFTAQAPVAPNPADFPKGSTVKNSGLYPLGGDQGNIIGGSATVQSPYDIAMAKYKKDLAAYEKAKANAGQNWLETWTGGLSPEVAAQFNEYNNQGLTAADYRAEERMREQEAQAKAAEEARKAAITQSRGAIDTALSPFDDTYFDSIGQTVLDYYLPQLEDQRSAADEQLTYKLARQGLLHSTAAADNRAKLAGDYDLQKAGLTSKAQDAERDARESVGATKSQLYSFADVAADPAAVDSRLASETARIRASAPELTPMGQVFTDYLTPIVQTIGGGLAAEAQGYRGFNTGLFNSGGKSSAVNVVR